MTSKPKSTLGDLTKELPIHPAMAKALNSIYGYTSDGDGIRHGAVKKSEIDFGFVKYFVVMTSAYINYVVGEAEIESI